MTPFTVVFLIWLSPVFGGEGLKGSPVEVSMRFPTEAGCHRLVKELSGYQLKHLILTPCHPEAVDESPAPRQ